MAVLKHTLRHGVLLLSCQANTAWGRCTGRVSFETLCVSAEQWGSVWAVSKEL